MSNDQKIVKPDVVIELTDAQLQTILPLKNRQKEFNKGMIFGSVGIQKDGKGGNTIGLSYIPHELAEKIRDLAIEYFGGKSIETNN